nr:KpsF/GutQ family sugar-phosphate isomerase [Bacteroidota bacterium]
MLTTKKIIESARTTLRLEGEALLQLPDTINQHFAGAVVSIIKSSGRVIVTGIGKSAIIAQKIVATFNSTGTPAVFMHAADAVHGDLGIIQQSDTIICISNSGNTPEIKLLAPILRNAGNKLIAITGNTESVLAKEAHYVLYAGVTTEACPHNLAPTSSTTAQMAMGDALAVCLLQCRGFSKGDFARYHPGGALGKKLILTVDDFYKKNPVPAVDINAGIDKVILEISSKRLGATAVLKNKKLAGVITDGDLRRMLQKQNNFLEMKASDIMNANPKTIVPGTMAVDAFNLMKEKNITQLIIAKGSNYLGIIHLHDLLQDGVY